MRGKKTKQTNILQIWVLHWRKCIISPSRGTEEDAKAQLAPGVASSHRLDGSCSRQAGPSRLWVNGECGFVKHFERSRRQERILETTQEQSDTIRHDRARKKERNLKGNKLRWTNMKRKGRVPVEWCPTIDWKGNAQVQALGKNDMLDIMYLLDSDSVYKKETW